MQRILDRLTSPRCWRVGADRRPRAAVRVQQVHLLQVGRRVGGGAKVGSKTIVDRLCAPIHRRSATAGHQGGRALSQVGGRACTSPRHAATADVA
jgi:hypothetical protein